MCASEIWYHRRNIWGMGTLRQVMEVLDMVRSDWKPEDTTRSWQSWLSFIEGAASHGGFSVR